MDKIKDKISIDKYEAEAQGWFDECETDCVTVNYYTSEVANGAYPSATPADGPAISANLCHQLDPNCSTIFTDAGWPFW